LKQAATKPDQEPIPTLGEVLDFMRLIWAIDHSLQRASKKMSLSMGLTGPQRLVLRIVGRFPGVSAGRLATIMHLHPSTLTGVLRRLSRRRLLHRRRDPHDARRVCLSLTDKGRELDVPASGTVEESVRVTLAEFKPPQVAVAQKLLSALADCLDRSLNPPKPEEPGAPQRVISRRKKA
jgi:DNA-binding MarR family transcriptional regulator